MASFNSFCCDCQRFFQVEGILREYLILCSNQRHRFRFMSLEQILSIASLRRTTDRCTSLILEAQIIYIFAFVFFCFLLNIPGAGDKVIHVIALLRKLFACSICENIHLLMRPYNISFQIFSHSVSSLSFSAKFMTKF